jgi:hypothetical protein
MTAQKTRSVPPATIEPLLSLYASHARSAYVIPFADPRGGWFDHGKLEVFNDEGAAEVRGDHVEPPTRMRWRYNGTARKYLVRRAEPPRLFFPLATMTALEGPDLWVVEGMKKATAVAQLGLPAVGIESALELAREGEAAQWVEKRSDHRTAIVSGSAVNDQPRVRRTGLAKGQDIDKTSHKSREENSGTLDLYDEDLA